MKAYRKPEPPHEKHGLPPDPKQPLLVHERGAAFTAFESQTLRRPDHPAILDPAGTWSYRQLHAASEQIAHLLICRGIQPGHLVAIYAHRSRPLVAALLGIWKAGAAFIILDAEFPPTRLAQALRLANPNGLLELEAAGELTGDLADFADAHSWQCRERFCLADFTPPRHPAAPPASPLPPPSADALAYIAFTSGSTGQPKGILGTHRPLSHFIHWHIETFGLRETDRFSLLSGLSHDPLLRDILAPLSLGATLVIPAPELLREPVRLHRWLQEMEISVVHLTPPLAELLDEAPVTPETLLCHWRYAFFGGDRLTRRHLLRLRRRAPSVACVNFYGATETPQAMAFHRAHPDDSGPELIPLGRGIDGVQLLLLDNTGHLVPPGQPGEIHIRTPYLSLGYLGSETQTRERFIPNPFTTQPGDRLYRTGDLGQMRPDGTVEFLGRADRQIKVRGLRIEPAEIESLLADHPRVQHAHVRWCPEQHQLAAYVVPVKPAEPDFVSLLRRHLRERLPAPMVPGFLIPIDALPLTANGKVDTAMLPAPVSTGISQEPAGNPADTLELQLQKLWEELLHLSPIGTHENFFDLGGHSLLAASLFARIQQLTGSNLPLAALFQAPTIAQLAGLIRNGGWESLWAALVPIQPLGSNPPLFLVHPVGGNVLGYHELASHLPPDQPIFGLQALGLRGTEQPLHSVEEMASHYLKEIRTLKPHGPYLLVGYSSGGIVAFEMAQQLRQQGEPVPLLVLLDTAPSGSWKKPIPIRLLGHLRVLWQIPLREKLRYATGKISLLWSRSINPLSRFLRAARKNPSAAIESPEVLEDVRASNRRAILRYRPAVYPGPVVLFLAQQRHDFYEEFQREPDEGWKPFASGGLVLRLIPGDHGQILGEPNVTQVARELQTLIDEALQKKHA